MVTQASLSEVELDLGNNASLGKDPDYRADFISFVGGEDFPCVGAKAAVNSGAYILTVNEELASERTLPGLADALQKFMDSELRPSSSYATFIAIFRQPGPISEEAFERLLWTQLQQLHRVDALKHSWDGTVSSDPIDSHFSFSFGGEALYVVGLHPNSSRLSRRFLWPTLVFNPHGQFERLRQEGHWERMQSTIRGRDLKLQGSANPMLNNFGERSEARQYSGRAVLEGWKPPFKAVEEKPARRCPFGMG